MSGESGEDMHWADMSGERRRHGLRGQINVAATPCGWRLTRLTERKAVRRRASVS